MAGKQSRTVPYHRIKWLSVVGGFLDGVKIDFSSGLNCIIGGRGTGKTTVLELIRYVLNEMPDDADARSRIESLVDRNLDFGRAEIGITTSGGMSYIVSRSRDEEPVVMTENRQSTDLILQSGSLFKADIYSQNEVESIADRADSQLELINSFEQAAIHELTTQAARIAIEVAGLSKDVGQSQAKIAALREETNELKNVEEQLKGMTVSGTGNAEAINTAHTQKAMRDREKRAVQRVTDRVGTYGQSLKAMLGVLELESRSAITKEFLEGPNKATFSNTAKSLQTASKQVDGHINQALEALTACWTQIQEQSKSLTAAHGAQEMTFRDFIEKQQAVLGEASKRTTLEKRRNDLLAKLQEMQAEEAILEKLQNQRKGLLDRLAELRDSRFSKRDEVCVRLSKSLASSDIRVSIKQDGNKKLYRDQLNELLKGGRVQESSKDKIISALFPSELVQIVRNRDVTALIDKAELAVPVAEKIISILAPHEGLHDLETVELVDEPRIELNDGGKWKGSRDLSTGQKCTAILPILLMESEKPLLIDQPEDNLDNRYVSDKVVRTISAVKKNRQLIFVTHNPNIPVLGDAERVFVFDSNGTVARVTKHGSVDDCKDDIVNLLEGGREAFNLRAERYKK